MLRVLSLLEARVLGVLVEKQRTVPDSYPLTLNALIAGCNQKSSRDPVLNADETDVRAAVDGLKSMVLAIERSGERVARRRCRPALRPWQPISPMRPKGARRPAPSPAAAPPSATPI